MWKRYLAGIAVAVLTWRLLLADAVFVPSAPQPQIKVIPVTLFVRDVLLKEPVAGAEVRFAILLKPIFGPAKSLYFKSLTDNRGECHFSFDPVPYEKLDWACEAEKRLPDGRILRDIELPAFGEVALPAETKKNLLSIKLSVYVYDLNSKDWPLPPRFFEVPLPEESLDQYSPQNPAATLGQPSPF